MLNFEVDAMEVFFGQKLWPRRANTPQTADVMEMWCGTMPFTLAAGQYEFVCVEPSDLWNGWDLS